MNSATIFVVDDDEAIRRALQSAGNLLDAPVQVFENPARFLEFYTPDQPGCLVLDVKMPGMSGLELQRTLADRGWNIPIVMMSGHADVRIAVQAMTLGALTLLEKPFSLDELLGQLRKAIAKDREQRANRNANADIKASIALLTPKEREVLDLVLAGQTNRTIAENLGLSVRAIEERRARLMKKLQVNSLAELVARTHQA